MGKWLDLLESETIGKTEKRVKTVVSKVFKTQTPPFGTTAQSDAARRYAYRFALHNAEGSGTYLTDEPDLDKARDNLLDRYGDSLALVVRA